MDIHDLKITIQASQLSEGEETLLAKLLTDPVVKKWLQIMMFNQIQDHANIPLSTLAGDGAEISALKQAFLKGGLSILQTIDSITPPQPTSVRATQTGQSPQR